jgi:hypothetical protein
LEYTPHCIEWKAIWWIYYPKDSLKDRVEEYEKVPVLAGGRSGNAGDPLSPVLFSFRGMAGTPR